MTQMPDTKAGFYYVSVKNQKGDFRLLAGPYVNDHAGALQAVDAFKKKALDLDPKAHWYAFGTVRSDDDLGPGILN